MKKGFDIFEITPQHLHSHVRNGNIKLIGNPGSRLYFKIIHGKWYDIAGSGDWVLECLSGLHILTDRAKA